MNTSNTTAMVQNRITYLLQQYLARQATPAEIEEFNALVQDAGNDNTLREALAASWLQFTTNDEMPQQQADTLFNNIITTSAGLHSQPAKVINMFNRGRMVAAAIIMILIGIGAWLYIYKGSSNNNTTKPAIADVTAPASSNAVLTLANGQKIELNKTASGNIAQEDNANITKLADGQIVYSKTAGSNATVAYNTLTVPRGSQVVNIVLADGSKVWLNAASSIRYPVVFNGNERTLEMSGEVYFEVAKDAKKKFIVNISRGASVEVLGTHFNINAYPDEDAVKTTLLEGKVRVNQPATGNRQSANDAERSVVLKPGEQAVLAAVRSPLTTHHSSLTIDHSPDLEQVLAWKNGRFEFSGNTIEPIMQQVARWYDVQIEYRGPKPTENFMGGTTRQANVSELLKILEQTQAVRFHLEDKKIIVSKP